MPMPPDDDPPRPRTGADAGEAVARLLARLEAAEAEIARLRSELALARAPLPPAAPPAAGPRPPRRRLLPWRRARPAALPGAATGGADPEDLAEIAASPLFDAEWYRAAYPDAAATGLAPAAHYLLCGAAEGRDPSPAFSTRAYLAANPEVAAGGLNPLLHWLRHGRRAGRATAPPPAADWPPPRPAPEDVAAVDASPLFDPEWYLAGLGPGVLGGLSPAEHYLRHGRRLGRDPGPGFDTRHYLAANPDVARAGVEPFLHYLRHGAAEGRAPLPGGGAAADPVAAAVTALHALGLTEAPLAELGRLAAAGDAQGARAAQALALWEMRSGGAEGAARALPHLAAARAGAAGAAERARLAVAEILCHAARGDTEAAEAAFARAAAEGAVTSDLHLARSAAATTEAGRLAALNAALACHGIPPLALRPGPEAPFDRLVAAAPPRPVPPGAGPCVSVLVAAWNAEATLATALASLVAQSWANLEILVIDDASSDATAAVAEHWAGRDARIRLIRLPRNAGAYAARNAGLAAARGDFVTLQDADDWAHPLRIETQLRALEAAPEAIGCLCEQARATEALRFLRWTGAGQILAPAIASLMVRRRPAMARLGGWDELRVAADSEFIARLRAVWGPAAVRELATGPLLIQRDRPGSAVTDPVLGIAGHAYGARRAYRALAGLHHRRAASLCYAPGSRPFPVPAILTGERAPARLGLVIGADLRGQATAAAVAAELRALAAAGVAAGVFELFRPDPARAALPPADAVLAAVVEGAGRLLVHGERAEAGRLVLRGARAAEWPQRFVPEVAARAVHVVLDDPADAAALPRAAATIAAAWGAGAAWHPASADLRGALAPAAAAAGIALSPLDWPDAAAAPAAFAAALTAPGPG